MGFMSKFRKERGDEPPDELIGESVDEEGEGLFMAAGNRPAPASEEDEAAIQALDLEREDSRIGDAAREETAAAQEEPEPEPEATSEAPAPAADDDPLAIFRETKTVSETGSLTGDLEEVSARELLEDLKELRGLLLERGEQS